MTSDHGNLEDASHTVHTENPVPLLALGPRAAAFEGLTPSSEVTPRLAGLLRGRSRDRA